MSTQLRFSEHPLSQKWIAQFHTSEDRARAARLLNLLKLVSGREFEVGIERALSELQVRLNTTIAVYPVTPPNPIDVLGYHPFKGGIREGVEPGTGRREQHGSEGRVAHILTGLQRKNMKSNRTSAVECTPTVKQLKTQGIRHIVLIDDVCGSGQRITKYWRQVIPKSVKSLLSLKRCELWVVVYAITPAGTRALKLTMPRFPLNDHLISVMPAADVQGLLTPELTSLCVNYAKKIDLEMSGIGYRGSGCPVVFEHGCPNNLPAILWASRPGWKGLFPNRAVPTDMRSCFDGNGTDMAIEALWRSNQPKLALSLLEALNHATPLTNQQRLLLTLLGLRLRGISEADLATRLLMTNSEISQLLCLAETMELYDKAGAQATPMGREFVARFRERFDRRRHPQVVARNPEDYYPSQCEGKLRELGIADQGSGRSVPMEL